MHLLVARREGVEVEIAQYTKQQAADTSRGDITAWYLRPLEQGRGVWNDQPYYSPLSKRWWSGGYGAPFSYTDGGVEVEGVVYADVSLRQIQLEVYDAISEAMKAFPLEASYAFIISKSGHGRSFFSYRLNSYSTDFGLGDEHRSRLDFPELYFNVGLDRVFLNPFIGNFIPLVVVAFLLFAVLWTVRLEPETSEVMGFNSSAVLGFCAALFFVVIVAHTSLRDSLAAQRIVYLEYFYFVLYVAILGVAVNSIYIASPTAARWIRHEDNLAARLLFWPLVTVSLLWITIVAFS